MSTTVTPGHTYTLRGTLEAGQTVTAESGAPGYPTGALIAVRSSALNQGTIDLRAGPGYRVLPGATGATLSVTGLLTNAGLINAEGGTDAFGHNDAVGGAGVEITASGSVLNSGTVILGGAQQYLSYATRGVTSGAILRDNGILTNNGSLLVNGSKVPGHAAGATAIVGGLLTNDGFVNVGSSSGYHDGRGGVLRVLPAGTLANNGTIDVGPGGDGGYRDLEGTATFQISGELINSGLLSVSYGFRPIFGGYSQGALVAIDADGTIINEGSISIVEGYSIFHKYGGAGTGLATLTDVGSLTNLGTISADGLLTDNALLTNDGMLGVGGGGGGYYSVGSAPGTLNVVGTLENTGTVQVSAGVSSYPSGYYRGGSGGRLLDPGLINNSGIVVLSGAYNRNSIQASTGATLSVTGVLVNSGTIDVKHGTSSRFLVGGATLEISGTLTNSGSLYCSGAYGGYIGGAGVVSISASGRLINPGTFTGSGTLDNAGALVSGDDGVVTGTVDSTIVNTGKIVVANDGALSVQGPIVNTGLIEVDGNGRLTISGEISNVGYEHGYIGLGVGSVLTLDAEINAFQTIDFAGTYSTLALSDSAAFQATIEGLRPQTTIDFLSTAVTSAVANDTTLAIGLATGGTFDLKLAAPLASYVALSLSSDLHGGTDLVVTGPSDVLRGSMEATIQKTTSISSITGRGLEPWSLTTFDHGQL